MPMPQASMHWQSNWCGKLSLQSPSISQWPQRKHADRELRWLQSQENCLAFSTTCITIKYCKLALVRLLMASPSTWQQHHHWATHLKPAATVLLPLDCMSCDDPDYVQAQRSFWIDAIVMLLRPHPCTSAGLLPSCCITTPSRRTTTIKVATSLHPLIIWDLPRSSTQIPRK